MSKGMSLMKIAELLGHMKSQNGSDLFLTDGKSPHLRVAGKLYVIEGEVMTAEHFQEFFKEWLPDDTGERLQKDKEVDIGVSMQDDHRYRLNLFYQKGKIAMVARLVPPGDFDWQALRLPETLKRLAKVPRGLVLITGTTGRGKSTTMAALLDEINSSSSRHILTIEDPIEFLHHDKRSVVSQREVGSDTHAFLPALRSALRQNPDVIFIGELRDAETVQTAVAAAMTGHLVFATVHTQDVVRTLERVLGLFPTAERDRAALDISSALEAIVSQRLVPGRQGNCLVAAFEIMFKTPFAERLIAQRRFLELEEVIKSGEADGMTTFTHSLAQRVNDGLITKEAALAVATNRDELALVLQGMETGISTFKHYGKTGKATTLSVRDLLGETVMRRGSDLLLTVDSPPQIRVGGILRPLLNYPRLTAEQTRRLLFSVLNVSQRGRFEEDKEIDFAMSISDHFEDVGEGMNRVRFRVNGFFQRGTIGAVFRQVPQDIPSAESISLPTAVRDLIGAQQGLVLVTGPTGSGKSTTLACLINEINTTMACHIITIEDPIEFIHSNNRSIVEQREIGADTHSFAIALRHALREDPDVILVGEMRDLETIQSALTAAETGHLVFGTLHTNDAAQALERIVDVFPPDRQEQIRVQLASSLVAVVSQRLLPRKGAPGERVAAFEIMLATNAIRKQIREGQTHLIKGTIENSKRVGMVTMGAALEELLQKGLITPESFHEVTSEFGGIA